MPTYFKSWEQGLPSLREQLKKTDDWAFLSGNEKKRLKVRLQAAGLAADQPNAMPFTGRTRPLLAVFDPVSLKIVAMLRPG